MKLSEPNILKLRLHKILLDRKIQPVRVMVTGDWHISPIISEKQLNYLKDAIVESDPATVAYVEPAAELTTDLSKIMVITDYETYSE